MLQLSASLASNQINSTCLGLAKIRVVNQTRPEQITDTETGQALEPTVPVGSACSAATSRISSPALSSRPCHSSIPIPILNSASPTPAHPSIHPSSRSSKPAIQPPPLSCLCFFLSYPPPRCRPQSKSLLPVPPPLSLPCWNFPTRPAGVSSQPASQPACSLTLARTHARTHSHTRTHTHADHQVQPTNVVFPPLHTPLVGGLRLSNGHAVLTPGVPLSLPLPPRPRI